MRKILLIPIFTALSGCIAPLTLAPQVSINNLTTESDLITSLGTPAGIEQYDDDRFLKYCINAQSGTQQLYAWFKDGKLFRSLDLRVPKELNCSESLKEIAWEQTKAIGAIVLIWAPKE